MTLEILRERLEQYSFQTKQEEENAVKEICQEIAIAAISRADFFKVAAFQGGTCLRVLFGLNRFSEDLDFVLKEPSASFRWSHYFLAIQTEFTSFGLQCEAIDRSDAPGNIKKAFLKENSFGQVLNLRFKRQQSDIQKISIKLEIDTNPPEGSLYETHYLDYPYPFSVVSQSKESLFASKCHALLCREYVKGRDWFDFLWYVQRKIAINLPLLKGALQQQGPYRGKEIPISMDWVIGVLREKIQSIDWILAKKDVERFISLKEGRSLEVWSLDFFLHMLDKIKST
jgi:predicted nucleotidyltransferase component of viral defense system